MAEQQERSRPSAMAAGTPPVAPPVAAAPAPAVEPPSNPFGDLPISDLPVEPDGWLPEHADPSRRLEDRDPKLETYFFAIDDEHEWRGARVWFAKHAAGFPFDNLVQELDLAELRPGSTIFVLARKGTRLNPVKAVQPITGRNHEGYLIHETRSAEDYAEEFGLYGGEHGRPGIRCGDPQFWNYRGGRMSGGGLQYDKIVDEIAKFSMPEVPRWTNASEKPGGPRASRLRLKRL